MFIGIIPQNDIKDFTDHNILETLPPDSVEQQAQIMTIQDADGYNWGYDRIPSYVNLNYFYVFNKFAFANYIIC